MITPPTSNRIAVSTTQRGLFRITEKDRSELERHLYKRYPHREWGAFFRFGFRRVPWGIALTFMDALWPQAGDLRRDSPIVTISSQYSLRAVDAVSECPFGIGMIHSHPQGCGTFPSDLDDDMDAYYTQLFEDYAPGRPYGTMIFSREADGQFRFTGRVHLDGQWLPVDELLTVGDELFRETAQVDHRLREELPATTMSAASESVTARLEMLLGSASTQRLNGATIAVIGCSGTGSPAVETLVRAGVGRFILVDPQRLAPSNLERLRGSELADAFASEPPFKVAIMARMIRRINPDAHVCAFVGNILADDVLDELLKADLLLGCTDTQHSRAALGDFAAHYLLPSIDVGVVFEGAHGEVGAQLTQFTQFRPDQPCAFCEGMIDPVTLAMELMSEEEKASRREAARIAEATGSNGQQYWRGDTPPLLTVGYLTAMAGNLVAGYAVGWLTGKFSMPHARFQFDISAPEFGFVEVERTRRETCSCGKTSGFSDQGKADRSVTMPSHWR